jgi:hypothetical protein
MEIPADVLIHNETLGLKGARARLLQISPQGYYEAVCGFGERAHRVLLPIETTVVIAVAPEPPAAPGFEVER